MTLRRRIQVFIGEGASKALDALVLKHGESKTAVIEEALLALHEDTVERLGARLSGEDMPGAEVLSVMGGTMVARGEVDPEAEPQKLTTFTVACDECLCLPEKNPNHYFKGKHLPVADPEAEQQAPSSIGSLDAAEAIRQNVTRRANRSTKEKAAARAQRKENLAASIAAGLNTQGKPKKMHVSELSMVSGGGRPHAVHSGVSPMPGCSACAEAARGLK